ncbi:MAG: hypothetical protein AAFY58_02650 [Planctomycetota bacterium]
MSNTPAPQPVPTPTPERSGDLLTRTLVCSAIALIAAVLWQAASLPRAEARINTSRSGMVTNAGAHAMMSTATPRGRAATLVLDQRAESLLVYSSGSGDRIELLGRYNLPELFRAARAAVDNP